MPANTLKLYVMGKPLDGLTAGLGGSSTLTVAGKYRGQSSSSDYAPAVSAIRFDDDGSTNWYFGASTTSGVDFQGHSTDLNGSNFDFASCVRHEFLHCLGFSSNDVFTSFVHNGLFTGSHAEAANHNDPVPVTGSSHIADSLTSVINAATFNGIRRDLTAVEWGMLQDLGWDVVSPPGFYRNYDLLTAGEDGEVALDVLPSRGVYLMRIDALNGDRIVVTTSDGSASNPKGVDTYLKLFDDQGNLLASNDDASDATTKSALSYTVTRGGTFYVGASTYGQRNYTFTTPPTTTASGNGFRLVASIAERADPTPDDIASVRSASPIGTDIRASLNQETDVDYFRIDAVAGRVYTAGTSLSGGGLAGASIVTIYDATGHKVAGMPATGDEGGSYYGQVSFTATTTGAYYVMVARFAGPDAVALNEGSLGVGWSFISSVDGYSGSGGPAVPTTTSCGSPR